MYRAKWAGLIGAVLVMGGCGSSSETSLTKAEFIAQGNAICKEGLERKGAELEVALRKQAKKSPNLALGRAEEERLVTSVALPPIEEAVEELGDLGTPNGEEEIVDAIIDGFEVAIQKVEENPSSALTSASSPFGEPDKKAKAYGLGECAKI